MKKYILLTLLPFFVAGCDMHWARQGNKPPPLLVGENDISISLSEEGAYQAVAQALAKINDPQKLHVTLSSVNKQQAETIRHMLTHVGVNAARIYYVDSPADMLVIRRYLVARPDCRLAVHKSWTGDVSNSLSATGSCVQASALAEEIDNPGDLVQPAHLQPANGARFGRVVELWEQGADKNNQQQPVSQTGSGSVSGASGSAGGSDSSLTPASQTTPAETTTTTPLAARTAGQSDNTDDDADSVP